MTWGLRYNFGCQQRSRGTLQAMDVGNILNILRNRPQCFPKVTPFFDRYQMRAFVSPVIQFRERLQTQLRNVTQMLVWAARTVITFPQDAAVVLKERKIPNVTATLGRRSASELTGHAKRS
jgi:hypothetical protein